MRNCTPLWREAIFRSKCTIHTIPGPLLEVAMSKKGPPLWREAHLQAKCTKHTISGPLLEVAMSKMARRCGAKHICKSKSAKNTPFPDDFWKLRCQKMARRCGGKYICKPKCTKHTNPEPLLEVAMSKTGTPLWRVTDL